MKTLHWQIPFRSKYETLYLIRIYTEDYTGSVVNLVGSDAVFVTSEKNDADIFTPVRPSTGYLRIFDADGELRKSGIIPLTNTSHYLELTTIDGEVKWQGFVKAEFSNVTIWDNPSYLELTVQSLLGVMDNMYFDRSIFNAVWSVRDSLVYMFREINILCPHNVLTKCAYFNRTTPSFLDYRFYMLNFFSRIVHKNEDREVTDFRSVSFLEFLKEIMLFCGLSVRERGDTLYIIAFDYHIVKESHSTSNFLTVADIINDTASNETIYYYKELPDNFYNGNKNTENYSESINSIELTCDINAPEGNIFNSFSLPNVIYSSPTIDNRNIELITVTCNGDNPNYQTPPVFGPRNMPYQYGDILFKMPGTQKQIAALYDFRHLTKGIECRYVNFRYGVGHIVDYAGNFVRPPKVYTDDGRILPPGCYDVPASPSNPISSGVIASEGDYTSLYNQYAAIAPFTRNSHSFKALMHNYFYSGSYYGYIFLSGYELGESSDLMYVFQPVIEYPFKQADYTAFAFPAKMEIYDPTNHYEFNLENGIYMCLGDSELIKGQTTPVFTVMSEMPFTSPGGFLNVQIKGRFFIPCHADIYDISSGTISFGVQIGEEYWNGSTWTSSPSRLTCELNSDGSLKTNRIDTWPTTGNDGYYIPIPKDKTGIVKVHIYAGISVYTNAVESLFYKAWDMFMTDCSVDLLSNQTITTDTSNSNTYYGIVDIHANTQINISPKICTFNNNKTGYAFIFNGNDYLTRQNVYNSDVQSLRPELDLVQRYKAYYQQARANYKLELTPYADKYQFYRINIEDHICAPVAIKRNWLDDELEVTYTEIL